MFYYILSVIFIFICFYHKAIYHNTLYINQKYTQIKKVKKLMKKDCDINFLKLIFSMIFNFL